MKLKPIQVTLKSKYHNSRSETSLLVTGGRFFNCAFQNLQLHFTPKFAYTGVNVFLGGVIMRETNDPYADLEDLIYEEDDGLPSNR